MFSPLSGHYLLTDVEHYYHWLVGTDESSQPSAGQPRIETPRPPESSTVYTSFSQLFLRVTWYAIGPMALAMVTILMLTRKTGWFSAYDLTFCIVLGLMIGARWLAFARGDHLNAFAEPGTVKDLRRYTVVTAALGIGLWVTANILGNQVLN